MRIRNKLLALLLIPLCAIAAGGIDIQKLKLKGEQHTKDLKYFQSTGLIAARTTQIEMLSEAFEKSVVAYREAKPGDRNLALKAAQQSYEKFNPEFKAIAEIFRDAVDKYQAQYNEKSGEAFADTTTKEKTLAAIDVGKQNESRALAAYNNRNYAYSAHLYLRSLKHYHKAFEFRRWAQLVKIEGEPKGKLSKKKNP